MLETTDIKSIVEHIRAQPISVIAIDGMDGSGKTTLSKKLQRMLKCHRITLDKYLNKNAGNYVEFINYARLQQKISHSPKLLLIEGTCCLAVLERLGVVHDYLIYVKKYSRHGYWRDQDECDVQGDIEDFVKQEKESLLKFCELEANLGKRDFDPSTYQFPPFREELFRYHYKFRPHQVADMIFKRFDC